MVRLPNVGGDDGTWGNYLNDFLTKEHYQLITSGSNVDNAANGGHKKITIQAGTATAGTAPLKFTSGVNLSSTESGAMEYDGSELYFTLSDLTRRTIAMYDDASGALGDIYYRNSTGSLTRLAIGTFPQTLSIVSGVPSWSASYQSSSTASTSTVSPAGDSRQNEYFVTALATNITGVSAPSGSPTNGNLLLMRIKDDGTARSITNWNTIYRGVARALPTTTTLSKTMYLGFKYNSTDTKWDLIAYAEES